MVDCLQESIDLCRTRIPLDQLTRTPSPHAFSEGIYSLWFRRALKVFKDVEPVFQVLYVVVSGCLLLGLGSGVVGLAKNNSATVALLGSVLIAVSLIGAASFVLGTAAVSYMPGSWLMRRPAHKYKLALKELIYIYHDETHMCCTRRFDVQALDRSVDVFTDRFRWSGTGSVAVTLKTDDGQSLDRQYDREFWQYYDVRFSPALKKSDIRPVRVETDVDCVDEGGTAKPFLSTTVEHPTDRLVLHVFLPAALRPRHAIAQIYEHYTAEDPLDFEELPVDRKTGEIRWDVPKDKIKMWQKYVIYFQD